MHSDLGPTPAQSFGATSPAVISKIRAISPTSGTRAPIRQRRTVSRVQPSPAAKAASVVRVDESQSANRMLRGLHHFGAAANQKSTDMVHSPQHQNGVVLWG